MATDAMATSIATTATGLPESTNVTSGQDIADLISRCDRCTDMTNGASYILSYVHLPTLKLEKKRKLGIIVNTVEDNSSVVGHWFALVVYASDTKESTHGTCLYCDGQNNIEINKPKVLQAIKDFCFINNLTYTNLDLRCQMQASQACGFICLFFLGKASLLSLESFVLLRNTMKRNSVRTNENYAIHFVRSHYKLSTMLR